MKLMVFSFTIYGAMYNNRFFYINFVKLGIVQVF